MKMQGDRVRHVLECLFMSSDVMTKLDKVNGLGDLSHAERNGVLGFMT
jgi:hypothetical protein